MLFHGHQTSQLYTVQHLTVTACTNTVSPAVLLAGAEFELLGQQQEVTTRLEAAQQQLADAQARATAATTEGNTAREQLNQVGSQ